MFQDVVPQISLGIDMVDHYFPLVTELKSVRTIQLFDCLFYLRHDLETQF